jgi:SAM-dependent MidA family methyltransferase
VRANQRMMEIIKHQILTSPEKSISFREYMELCLYYPEFGYYTNSKEKVGKGGDFYTSVSLGGLMGEVLAQYIISQTADSTQKLTLTEWGGGTGGLAQQLLDELERNHSEVYQRIAYISVEISPHHRALQAEKLSRHVAADRVKWMTEEEWFAGGPWDNIIVYSNELVDAFPIHRIKIQQGKPCECFVEWDEDKEGLLEKWITLADNNPLNAYINNLNVSLQEGQQLEINVAGTIWIRRVCEALHSGQLLTIDYGDQVEEVVAAHRMNGTLMCYRSHVAEDNPFLEPGGQDITSHVNFTALIQGGLEAGFQKHSLMTQKRFLVENGLLNKLQDTYSTDPFSPAAKRNRAIRQLLLSDQMSELFKVLILKKGELL